MGPGTDQDGADATPDVPDHLGWAAQENLLAAAGYRRGRISNRGQLDDDATGTQRHHQAGDDDNDDPATHDDDGGQRQAHNSGNYDGATVIARLERRDGAGQPEQGTREGGCRPTAR